MIYKNKYILIGYPSSHNTIHCFQKDATNNEIILPRVYVKSKTFITNYIILQGVFVFITKKQ